MRKKWVASNYTNSISFKNVTPMDERFPRGSFHDTWDEAHAALVARRAAQFAKAEKEFQRARTAVIKAKAMKPPQPKEEGTPA